MESNSKTDAVIAGDYFLPEELSIQQRQQEDLSHGTPISGAQTSYVGGTAKANPPKVRY